MTTTLNTAIREGEAPAEPLGQLDSRLSISRRAESTSILTIRVEPWSESIHAQWRDLERRLGNVPLAASSGWTASWVHVYADAVDVRVAVAERAGRICGLALLCRSRAERIGPFRLATCHIGTAGEAAHDSVCVEYNDLLCGDECRTEFAARLMDLAKSSRGFDEIRLDGFDETTACDLLADLPDVALTLRSSRFCDLQAIRKRGATVMDALGGNTRSSLRRALRKTGAVEVTQAASLDEADDVFTELLELHQARWRAAGQPGAFASTRFLAFQRELITRLLPEERVVLLRVRSESLTIGCLMLLLDRGRLLDYLSGFAPFDQTPSPGIVTHYLAMERALAKGYSAYDFLVGDKRHKENLATDSRNLLWATWRRPSLKNRTIAGLRRVKRAIAEVRERKAATVNSGEAGE
jgi:CelD/BcsL family acetyltransferase involved in cellulose biosynthesis